MNCIGCVNEYIKNQAWSSSLPHPCIGCSRQGFDTDKYKKVIPEVYTNHCPHCGKKI